jgi:hypothetical protein
MTISSRTPEGEPGKCPLCRSDVRVEPSVLFGDATCPNCGTLLWFFQVSRAALFMEHAASADRRERLIERLAEQLGVPKERITPQTDVIKDLGADSLDIVELVMELEEESGQ